MLAEQANRGAAEPSTEGGSPTRPAFGADTATIPDISSLPESSVPSSPEGAMATTQPPSPQLQATVPSDPMEMEIVRSYGGVDIQMKVMPTIIPGIAEISSAKASTGRQTEGASTGAGLPSSPYERIMALLSDAAQTCTKNVASAQPCQVIV
ncbi:uncharacterized protein LOC109824976 [Asparagus officinalis]|uniref:uncharacterized protein LOC109824976 n=1 Tax=Asparagus officinalis TaxID=4686 RepID=UPI00098E1326|nr:uncharacterized protein LOC109824976 [Asparagus officinalis]